MNLAQIMARLAEINQRMAAIKTEAQTPETTTERMAQLDGEVTTLTRKEQNSPDSPFNFARKRRILHLSCRPREIPQRRNERRICTAPANTGRRSKIGCLSVKQVPFCSEPTHRPRRTGLRRLLSLPRLQISSMQKEETRVPFLHRVTKRNYPAGMAIPTVNFKPELEWVAENGKPDRKKATTGNITFSVYKAQIRLAISLEARTMSLEQFEDALIDRIKKACARGFDKVIVAGTGSGQPTGILTGADYAKKAVKLNNKTMEDYSEWIKIWAKLPLIEQPGAQLHINKTDWQAHILGMKDSTGKVIALETMGFGGTLVPMFMGKEVVLLEDQGLPEFDTLTGNATASKATAFAYFFNDADYYFNSNMQLALREYIDEETDEKIHKATVLADGKVVDADSLLVVCRGTDAS